MHIKKLETFTQKWLSIVKVTADTGEEGIGQISPYNADISARVFHRQVAPHVLGKDPLEIQKLVNHCLEAEYKFPGSYICRALSGLDTALWDLKGKLENRSVCELLGAQPRPIKVYGSSMRRDITPEKEAQRLKRLKDEKGYEAFKIRIGSVCGHNQDQWPGRTEALVPEVRRAVGDEVKLFVDANSCYDAEHAIEVGELLAENGVVHFEEPCPYWRLDWTQEVTETLDIPVTGGEQDNSLEQWKRIINRPVVDVVQPDICYIGGFTRAHRVGNMAAEKGLPCTPHSANLSLVSVFTLHLLAVLENAGPYMEYSIEDSEWVKNLYTPELKVTDGKVNIPAGPGWGVEINEKWLSDADYQVSKLQE